MNKRRIRYKNEIGQELFFGNGGELFVENLDTDSIQGRPTAEQLAFSPGQRTIHRSAAARTVVADLAFCDRYGDKETMRTLCEIFSPLYSGELTVYGYDGEEYRLTVTPAANVQPVRQSTPWIYKMSVDFVADDPFWRVGSVKDARLHLNNTGSGTSQAQDSKNITYSGTVKAPLYISVSPVDDDTKRAPVYISVGGKGLYIYDEEAPARTIIINSETLAVTDSAGNDASTSLDAHYEISELYLCPGANTITVTVTGSGAADIVINYYKLCQGVPKW